MANVISSPPLSNNMILTTYLVVFGSLVYTVYARMKYHDGDKPNIPSHDTGSCRFENETLNEAEFVHGEFCNRPCNGKPKKCYFTFYVEEYTTMGQPCGRCPEVWSDCYNEGCVTANGCLRSFIALNRELPAPIIQVCQNDILVVDVMNAMHAETTSVHWHGIRQNGTDQYSDGAPYITQCPINPGNKFRYTFRVPDCGSFWYHSHSGMQKSDGSVGALIIKCIEEPLDEMYDTDKTPLVLIDWTNVPARKLVSGFTLEKQNLHPDTVLINGKSRFYNDNAEKMVPVTVIDVERGLKHRIRIIGGTGYTCAYMVQFQNHPVTLITVDGGNRVKPVECTTVIVNSAERFDVILNANQSADKLYYILIQGVGRCNDVTSYAVLRYVEKSSPPKFLNFSNIDKNSRSLFPIKRGITCNAIDSTCAKSRSHDDKKKNICIIDLDGDCNTPPISIKNENQCPSHKTHIFDFGIRPVSRDEIVNRKVKKFFMPGVTSAFLPLVNGVVFSSPPTTLLGSASHNPPNTFCNKTCLDRSVVKGIPCECTAIYPFPLNTCATIIIRLKDGGFPHPIHIHGYNPQIAFQEGGPHFAKMSDKELKALAHGNQTKSQCRPLKDVISVPAPGVVIMQFVTDNPGYWFFHCHWSFHGEFGMAVVLKVGHSWQHTPMPVGFPTCGDFITDCL